MHYCIIQTELEIKRRLSLSGISAIRYVITQETEESRAVARKPRDAAAVLFSLKFADDIHYKFKSSQASKARLQSSKHTGAKTEFNTKWRFRVIQSHAFSSQWKGDKALTI